MKETKEKNSKVFCPERGKEMTFKLDGPCAEWVYPEHGIMLVTSYFTKRKIGTCIPWKESLKRQLSIG